jgi:integrase
MQRIRSHQIHQSSYRRKLPPRPKDAYKTSLGKGRWIGYLKGANGSESWCACWTDDMGTERQRVVGSVAELTYEAALALVQQEIDQGLKGVGSNAHYTIRQACEDYIHNKLTLTGPKAEQSARNTLGPFILAHPIADKKLRELRHRDIEKWRDALPHFRTEEQAKDCRKDKEITRKANTCNRILRIFKATLNLAKSRKVIGSDDAWADIKSFKCKDGKREIYLDLEQRRSLLGASDENLRAFLTAMMYTGARPNEVGDALVEHFDAKTGTIRFVKYKGTGEADERVTHLTLAAVAFFKEQAKNKLPKAFLLTRGGEQWRKSWWCRDLDKAIARSNTNLAAAEKPLLPAGIVAYTMRHTAISEWLQQGIDIGRVAKAVGTSVKMIEEHYQQFIRSDFVDKLSNIKVV